MASLAPEDLERTIDAPIGKLDLDQTLETSLTGHIDAHCGEISALRGCQILEGYPW